LLPHKAPKFRRLNYLPDIDDKYDAHEHYLETSIKSYFSHILARKVETKNNYISQVSRIFHLSKALVLLKNDHDTNTLSFTIEGSANRDFWIPIKTETDLSAGSTYEEEISKPYGWVRVSWKSKVADTPALISCVVCAKS
jgi:hypothetical protein